MPKIIAMPDLHERDVVEYLHRLGDRLKAADTVLLVGDLANGNHVDRAAFVLDTVRQYNAQVLAVPGNWDGPKVQSYLDAVGVNLDGRHAIRHGLAFVGVGGALPSGLPMPNTLSEEQFAERLRVAETGLDAEFPRVLVCHEPPKDTCADLAWSDLHVGSTAIREYIERAQPLVCFTGHIHEGRGVDRIDKTWVVNPGPLWEGHYAYAEIEFDRCLVEVREV